MRYLRGSRILTGESNLYGDALIVLISTLRWLNLDLHHPLVAVVKATASNREMYD